MKHRVRFTLVAVVLLGVGTLVLGGLGAIESTRRGHSPYLSAMSDLAVPPAAAAFCNYKVCIYIDRHGKGHDHWDCTNSGAPTVCLLQNDNQGCTNIEPCI